MQTKYFAVHKDPYYKIWYLRIGYNHHWQLIVSFHDFNLHLGWWWISGDWRFEWGRECRAFDDYKKEDKL